jgi:hypothetical protein
VLQSLYQGQSSFYQLNPYQNPYQRQYPFYQRQQRTQTATTITTAVYDGFDGTPQKQHQVQQQQLSPPPDIPTQ